MIKPLTLILKCDILTTYKNKKGKNKMLRIINLKTNLYEDISLDNLSLKDFSKIVGFYATLKDYNYKIIR